jgi:dihydroflavonol-4-reductase
MILVTGGTGLLGAHLLLNLTRKSLAVRALRRGKSDLSSVKKIFEIYEGAGTGLFDKIEWIEGDVLDSSSLENAMQGVEHVYHCAAMVSFDSRLVSRMMQVNIEGTANVVNVALASGVKKFCHVSSVAALAKNEKSEIITEDNWWKTSKGNSDYAISKHGAEREAWRASEEGLDVIIINPSVILGPGNWNKSSSVLIKSAYKGFRFYTSGTVGFVDVRDVVNCMTALMESKIKNERFILSSENYSFRDFITLLHNTLETGKTPLPISNFMTEIAWRAEKVKTLLTGKKPLITKDSARSATAVTYFSNEKVCKALDYDFIPVKEAVRDVSKVFLNELNPQEQKVQLAFC